MGFIGAIEPNPKVSDLPWFRLAEAWLYGLCVMCVIFGWRKRE